MATVPGYMYKLRCATLKLVVRRGPTLGRSSRPGLSCFPLLATWRTLHGPETGLSRGVHLPRFPRSGQLQDREVGRELVRGDVASVGVPLGALVPEEEVEDMLPEHLGHQLRVLHRGQCLGQVLRQRLEPHRAAL